MPLLAKIADATEENVFIRRKLDNIIFCTDLIPSRNAPNSWPAGQ